jgi:hypothetical protein
MSKLPIVLIFGAILLLSSQALATNWGGPEKDDGCIAKGLRQYSARLWNIPWGSSWEGTCARTAWGNWGVPDRCKNMGAAGMWGEWHRHDPTCY